MPERDYPNPQDDPFAPGAPPRQSYPWWHDPDTDPPEWMLSPNTPPIPAADGHYWRWTGDHWDSQPSPGAPGGVGDQTVIPRRQAPAIDKSPFDPAGNPWSTGGGGGGGGVSPFTPGGGQGGMLGYSPYRSYGPFSPRTPTLSLDAFTPSSWEDAEQEPGYQQSQTRLRKQIEGGAAYQGMLRSGMTFDRLGDVLTNFGQQNFTNFDNRRFRNWEGNNAAKTSVFGANLGVDRDIYDRGSIENDRFNNYRFNTEDASFKDATQRWLAQVQSLTQLGKPVD